MSDREGANGPSANDWHNPPVWRVYARKGKKGAELVNVVAP
jgi:hypothetical protein